MKKLNFSEIISDLMEKTNCSKEQAEQILKYFSFNTDRAEKHILMDSNKKHVDNNTTNKHVYVNLEVFSFLSTVKKEIKKKFSIDVTIEELLSLVKPEDIKLSPEIFIDKIIDDLQQRKESTTLKRQHPLYTSEMDTMAKKMCQDNNLPPHVSSHVPIYDFDNHMSYNDEKQYFNSFFTNLEKIKKMDLSSYTRLQESSASPIFFKNEKTGDLLGPFFNNKEHIELVLSDPILLIKKDNKLSPEAKEIIINLINFCYSLKR